MFDASQGKKVNLTVRSLTGDEINLQNVLSVDQLPVVPNPALTRHEFEAWPHLQDLDLPAAHGEVLLLIGLDTPEAFWVKEERRGSAKEPYAVRGVLGWSVVGPRTTAQGKVCSVLAPAPHPETTSRLNSVTRGDSFLRNATKW